MAHFYGTLQGHRGQASRLGTKNSGLNTVAASWSGAIAVNLYVRNGVDCAQVRFRTWHGHGTDAIIYDGPVNGYGFVRLNAEKATT